jgi:hypothetical protein
MLANSFLQSLGHLIFFGKLCVNVAYCVDKLFFVAKHIKNPLVCNVESEVDSDAAIFVLCCYLNS